MEWIVIFYSVRRKWSNVKFADQQCQFYCEKTKVPNFFFYINKFNTLKHCWPTTSTPSPPYFFFNKQNKQEILLINITTTGTPSPPSSRHIKKKTGRPCFIIGCFQSWPPVAGWCSGCPARIWCASACVWWSCPVCTPRTDTADTCTVSRRCGCAGGCSGGPILRIPGRIPGTCRVLRRCAIAYVWSACRFWQTIVYTPGTSKRLLQYCH